MGNTVEIGVIVDLATGRAEIRGLGNEFERTGNKGRSGFQRVNTALKTLKANFLPTTNLVQKLGAAFGLYKLAGVAKGFMETSSSMERMELMLRGVEGGVAKARTAFAWMLDFATGAPFNLDALSNSFVKLKVAALEPMQGSMQGLVDAVAHFGGSSENLKRAAVAIQQMAGKGVISMEELRQQLGEHVPGAIKIMAREMGMSIGALVDKVSRGAVDAKTGLTALFRGFEKDFSGSAARMMSGWSGLTAQLSVHWQLFQKDVMDKDIFISVKAGLRTVIDLLAEWKKNGDMAPWAKSIATTVLSAFAMVAKGALWVGKAFMGWQIIWQGLQLAWGAYRAVIWKGMSWFVDKLAWVQDRIADAYAFWGRTAEAMESRGLAAQMRSFAEDASGASDALVDDMGTKGVAALEEAASRVQALDEGVKDLTERWRENKTAMEAANNGDSQTNQGGGEPPAADTGPSVKELAKMETAWDKITLAALPAHEQAMEEITRKYDDLQEKLTTLAFAKDLDLDEYESVWAALDARREEAVKESLARQREAEIEHQEKLRQERQEAFEAQHPVLEEMRSEWELTWSEIEAGSVNAWQTIGESVAGVSSQIASTFSSIVSGSKSAGEAASALFKNMLATAVNTLVQIGIQELILGSIQKTNTVTTMATATASTTAAMGAIAAAAAPAATLTSVATGGTSAAGGAAGFTAAMGAMMGLLGSLFGSLFGGGGKAKAAAEGGIFTSPTLTLFGEDGDEAVVPLSEKYRYQGRAIIEKILPRVMPELAAPISVARAAFDVGTYSTFAAPAAESTPSAVDGFSRQFGAAAAPADIMEVAMPQNRGPAGTARDQVGGAGSGSGNGILLRIDLDGSLDVNLRGNPALELTDDDIETIAVRAGHRLTEKIRGELSS